MTASYLKCCEKCLCTKLIAMQNVKINKERKVMLYL